MTMLMSKIMIMMKTMTMIMMITVRKRVSSSVLQERQADSPGMIDCLAFRFTNIIIALIYNNNNNNTPNTLWYVLLSPPVVDEIRVL